MAIDILGLTGTAELRAVLAISEIEAPDSLFTELNIEQELKLDLLTWRSDYATILVDGTEGSPTVAQQINMLTLKKFAKYFCALKIIIAGEVFTSQMVSDGNNTFKRYAADWEAIRARIASEMSSAKNNLKELVDSTTTAKINILGKSTPDYDPVAHK